MMHECQRPLTQHHTRRTSLCSLNGMKKLINLGLFLGSFLIENTLIHDALKKAKEIGYHSVIVLGHKDNYPKFGFK